MKHNLNLKTDLLHKKKKNELEAMFDKNIFKTMVQLQHSLNKKTAGNDYLEKELNWNSCIVIESEKLLNSFCYKQKPDIKKVKEEAIDLLHFVISEEIQRHHFNFHKSNESINNKYIVKTTIQNFERDFAEDNLLIYKDFKELIKLLNYRKYPRLIIMKKIFEELKMTNEDVYALYIIRNSLSKDRLENGFKEELYKDLFEQQYLDSETYRKKYKLKKERKDKRRIIIIALLIVALLSSLIIGETFMNVEVKQKEDIVVEIQKGQEENFSLADIVYKPVVTIANLIDQFNNQSELDNILKVGILLIALLPPIIGFYHGSFFLIIVGFTIFLQTSIVILFIL